MKLPEHQKSQTREWAPKKSGSDSSKHQSPADIFYFLLNRSKSKKFIFRCVVYLVRGWFRCVDCYGGKKERKILGRCRGMMRKLLSQFFGVVTNPTATDRTTITKRKWWKWSKWELFNEMSKRHEKAALKRVYAPVLKEPSSIIIQNFQFFNFSRNKFSLRFPW